MPLKTVPHGRAGEFKPDKKIKPFLKPFQSDLDPRQRRLIEGALTFEQEDVRAAGAYDYILPALAQAAFPHSDPALSKGVLYSRDTGRLTLTVALPAQSMEFLMAPSLGSLWRGFADRLF